MAHFETILVCCRATSLSVLPGSSAATAAHLTEPSSLVCTTTAAFNTATSLSLHGPEMHQHARLEHLGTSANHTWWHQQENQRAGLCMSCLKCVLSCSHITQLIMWSSMAWKYTLATKQLSKRDVHLRVVHMQPCTSSRQGRLPDFSSGSNTLQ